LVQRIADHKPDLYQRDAERILDTILQEIVSAMARGNRVELRGFGAFSVKREQAVTPSTGKLVPMQKKAARSCRRCR
jgi:integration host factor subunit beta